MSRLPFDALRRQIQQLAGPAAVAHLSDRQLLERYAQERDETAFADLLRRHGPLVRGVCRRVLHHAQDAEDAFQATFLVLARRAAAIRWHDSVGNWLYCVAYRLALKVRRAAEQRQALAEAAGDDSRSAVPPETDLAELCAVVDQEVLRLPEKCRIPVLLCYLEGQTRDQAARQLGWSLRTVERRLEQGREMLRARLTARGMTLTAALLSAELARAGASAAVPTGVVEATLGAARLFAEGKATSGAVLAEGVLQSMFWAKVKWAALALAACLLLGGVGLWARQPGTAPNDPQAAEPKAQLPEPDGPQAGAALPRVDLNGDPLPPGALARLGTVRLRHTGSVWSVAFAPDGKTLAAAGKDSRIRLWDVATGKEVRAFDRHQGIIKIAFAPDGKTLVSADSDQTLRQWDVATGKEIHAVTLNKKLDSYPTVVFAPDARTVAWASEKKIVQLWDVGTGLEIHTLKHPDRISTVAYAPDGKTLATGSDDKAVRLWDVASGLEIRTFEGEAPRVNFVAFAPDGKTLFTADSDQKLSMWDVATGKASSVVAEQNIRAIACSPDGKTLAVTGADDKIVLRDVATGKEIRVFDGKTAGLVEVAFAPDGRTLAAAARGDTVVRLWDVETGNETRAFRGHQSATIKVAYAPDGKTLASAGKDHMVRLWDLASSQEVRAFANRATTSVAYAPDGKTLATATGGSTVQLWDPSTGQEIRAFDGYRRNMKVGGVDKEVVFAPDGKTLAAGAYLEEIVLWDPVTGQEIRRFAVGQSLEYAVAYAPDGKTLAAAGWDRKIQLWSVTTGAKFHALDGHQDRVNAIAYAPDGKTLASAGEDQTVRLWDLATGKEIRALAGHQGAVYSVAYAPDGKTLASAGADSVVRLWDVWTGREIGSLAGHRGKINSVAFAPDGKSLASASDDTTILVWDVRTARLSRPAAVLTPQELPGLWDQLAGADLARVYTAVDRLSTSPQQSLPFLRERVQPAAAAPAERLKQLLTALESEQFAAREQAGADLQALGELAAPALRGVLDGKPTLEMVRRVEPLLAQLEKPSRWSGEQLRVWRVIQALERIGTPEAQAVLEKLAGGEPASRLTVAAKASLQRLAQRAAAAP